MIDQVFDELARQAEFDDSAMRELFVESFPLLLSVATKQPFKDLDPEDLVQETWTKLFLRVRRGEIHSNFRAYALACLRTTAFDALRRSSARDKRDDIYHRMVLLDRSLNEGPAVELSSPADIERFMAGLQDLEAKYEPAIHMAWLRVDGCTWKQVALEMNRIYPVDKSWTASQCKERVRALRIRVSSLRRYLDQSNEGDIR